MEPTEIFRDLTKHLVNCDIPLEGCQTCQRVFGERRPRVLMHVRFEERVRAWRKKNGLDASTPKEVE